MLTDIEKAVFIILAIWSIGLAYRGFSQLYLVMRRGQGDLHWDRLPMRAFKALQIYITQSSTLKTRPISSLFHLGIVWGFTFYFLVNFGDVLEAYIEDLHFLGTGTLADAYHLVADVLSVAVLVGMSYFLARRFFLQNRTELQFSDNILLHPKVQAGRVNVDSVIVGVFILSHVGARFLGESVRIELGTRESDLQPFAGAVSLLWSGLGLSDGTLEVLEHLFWWVALGGIILFLPYFPYTKHAHLFMAPLNYLTRPERSSMGTMDSLNLEDETVEQFGVKYMQHLPQTGIMDAFACIMCNRCQDVCPAYVAGTELSPSALEINKRFIIKEHMEALATGAEVDVPLMGNAISESAVWACTSCAACIEICPVGNEPMMDILQIRQDAVLMEGQMPELLGNAFNNAEVAGNPWGNRDSRLTWANDLDFDVPLIAERQKVNVLYWVGCAGAFDPNSQRTTRAVAKILNAAGVDWAVLGEEETCHCEWARRGGNEYLFQESVMGIVATMNQYEFDLIITHCPHCFNTMKHEFPEFGGQYTVVHHSQFIAKLINEGKIKPNYGEEIPDEVRRVTYHDSCYLGRYNEEYDSPREMLKAVPGLDLAEMTRSRQRGLCCGGGGAQVYMETHQEQPANMLRLTEAVEVLNGSVPDDYTQAPTIVAENLRVDIPGTIATACPFCTVMLDSAQQSMQVEAITIRDVAEIVADAI